MKKTKTKQKPVTSLERVMIEQDKTKRYELEAGVTVVRDFNASAVQVVKILADTARAIHETN